MPEMGSASIAQNMQRLVEGTEADKMLIGLTLPWCLCILEGWVAHGSNHAGGLAGGDR